MTVQAQNSTQYYSGPISVGTVLPIKDFTFIDNSHVSAKIRNDKTVWTYGVDYTVTGANTLDRNFTVLKDVPADKVLAIYLDVPITQGIAPEEGGNFPAATQEFVIDKLTYICQMLQERISRSLQISVDTQFNGTLPELIPNRTFKINEDGTGLVLSQFDPDTALVGTEAFKDAAEAAALAAGTSETNAKASETAAAQSAANALISQNAAEQAIVDVSAVKVDAIDSINLEEASALANIADSIQEAKDWAIKMDGKVEDIDYSARYYAELAATRVGSSMMPLFYRVISDHVLTGVEAKGKLLQGSLVTNLYPDAVAHVKADWDNGTIQAFTLDSITFEYKVAQDKHLIVDIANKTQVDNLFAKTGIAEFYILDYTNNQFYLPRNLWFDQYTNSPENVNKFNEAGLPDHSHTYVTKSGMLPQAGSVTNVWVGENEANTSNASESNPIYGKSNTVQPPSSNKLLYFVVGNTYVNQDDIDIAQVENQLNNKLNLDLSNITQTTKALITSLAVPDYTNGVQGVSGFDVWKTVDEDVLIVACVLNNSTRLGMSIFLKDTSGNIIPSAYDFIEPDFGTINVISAYTGSAGTGITPFIICVAPRGYSYQITGSGCTFKGCIEYPLKGVSE